jgi:transposase
MRFSNASPHRFYCGIDLHARAMHVCALDNAGAIVGDRNLPCHFEALLKAIAPFRDGIGGGGECMFGWYRRADRCAEHNIPFVVGHALYMKLIHGGKARSDRSDANKIAHLRNGGNFPLSDAYPKGTRETRDRFRRRMCLVPKRAERITHLGMLNAQNNRPPFGKKLSYAANRAEPNILERFTDPSVQMSAALDLDLIDTLDEPIGKVERHRTRTARVDDVQTYPRLRTIPGVAPILALVLLDEMHQVERFDHVGQFLSHARRVRCPHESAGKQLGSGGNKIGNAQLRWAFAEAVCLLLRSSERARQWKQNQAQKRGPAKALGILAARLARAAYHALRQRAAFDADRFWNGRAATCATTSATTSEAATNPTRRPASARASGRKAGRAGR